MKTLEKYIQENYSPSAVQGYESMIRRYTEYMGNTAGKGTYKDVLNYIGHLRKLKVSPKTLRNNLFAIKIYYRWLNATGQREDHPCQHLYLKDQINRRIAVESLYSKETLEELLKTHKNKRPLMQKRDEVLITLLIYQALLVLEIAQLNTENINLDEGTIKIKGNKKNKGRTLNVKPNQVMLLYQYMTEIRPKLVKRNKAISADDERALILSETGTRIYAHNISRIINKDKKPHERLIPIKIRQSVIKQLLKQNNDLRIVQVFAGHRRAGSTEEYKQSGLEELKTIIQKLHPLEAHRTSPPA